MSSAPLDLSLGRIETSPPQQPSRAAGDSFTQELQRRRKSKPPAADEDRDVSVVESPTAKPATDTVEPAPQPENAGDKPEQPSEETVDDLPDQEVTTDASPIPQEPVVQPQVNEIADVLPLSNTEIPLEESGEPEATTAAGTQQVLTTNKAQADEAASGVDATSATAVVKKIAVDEPVLQLETAGEDATQQQTGEELPSPVQPVNLEEAPGETTTVNAQQTAAQQAQEANDLQEEVKAEDVKSDSPATQATSHPAATEQNRVSQDGEQNGGSGETESKAVESIKPVAADSAGAEPDDVATQPTGAGQQAPPPAARARFSEALVGRAAAAKEDVSLTPAQRGRFVNRVSRAIEVAGNTDGVVRLRLSPKALGALKMQVQLNGQNLSATIEAESQHARSLLLDNLPVLRERLASQNISIESFDVNVSDQDDQQGAANQREQLADQEQSPAEPESRRNREENQQQETPADEKSSSLSIDDDTDGLNVTV